MGGMLYHLLAPWFRPHHVKAVAAAAQAFCKYIDQIHVFLLLLKYFPLQKGTILFTIYSWVACERYFHTKSVKS